MGRINTTSRNSWTNKATGIPCKRKARFRQWKKSNESYIHKRIETMSIDDLADVSEILTLKSDKRRIEVVGLSDSARSIVTRAIKTGSVAQTLIDVNKQIVAKIGMRG